jgi:Zn-dependent peptidase ImmA (M78 family)
MDLALLEALAVETYEKHGFDATEPVSMLRLARRALHPDVICRPPSVIGCRPASSGFVQEKPFIMLRRTIDLPQLGFFCGHELSHLLRGTSHGHDESEEAACDYLAACLMAPRPAVKRLYAAFGWDIAEIAAEVVATQTWAALRLAETMLVPLAAVTPTVVRVRGPEEHVWPDERSIREMARKPGPGIRKVRITDQPRRAAIVLEDLG